MTSARKPAGAPGDWSERAPAGTPVPPGTRDADVPPQENAATAETAPQDSAEKQAGEVASELDQLVEDLRRERDEYLDLAQRAKADFDNYRKRAAREAAEAEKRGKAGLARDLAPVLDDLERALQAAGVDAQAAGDFPAGVEAPSEEVSAHEALARGVALVYRELHATLERSGVEAYDPTGERFDPAQHEALSTRRADGTGAGVVIETLERGYRLDGTVIRPARVVVSE